MTDTTNIFPSLNDEEGSLDAFNVASAAWVLLYLMGLILFGASPPFNLGQITNGIVFGFMAIVAIAIPLIAQAKFGNIFTSSTTKYQSASVYVFFTALILYAFSGSILGGGGELSVLKTAEEANFLASFTSNLPAAQKAATVVNIAPIVETILAFSGAYLIAGFALQSGLREKVPGGGWTIAAIASAPVAIGFGLLHDSETARLSSAFFIRAFLIMFASMFVIFGEEITDRDYFPFAAVMAFAIAVHRALNLYEYGGYQAYFSDLMSASMPNLLLSYWWLLYDIIWVSIFAWGIGMALVKLFDPNFELKPVTRLKEQFNLNT